MSFFDSVGDKDVLNFFQALNLYVKAGIPEHNAIVRYGESVTHPVMKAMADDVVYRMENGMQLSQAMEQHPEVFSSLYIRMITIGELSGQLGRIITEIIFYIEQKMDIESKLSNATLGPKISACFISLGFFVAASYVVPQFATVLYDLKVEIPMFTKIILDIGKFLNEYWYLVFVFIALIVLAYKQFKKHNQEKMALLEFKLPFFKKLAYLSLQYSMTKLLGLCLSAGIQPEHALKYTALAIQNPYIKELLINASNTMTNTGKQLYECVSMHDHNGIMDADFMMILRVGSESGNLADTMLTTSEVYRKNYISSMDAFGTKISTVVLIPCAVAILAIYISILYPMYTIMNATNSV